MTDGRDTESSKSSESDAPQGPGEDDGSTSVEGKDDHLKDDQKPTTK